MSKDVRARRQAESIRVPRRVFTIGAAVAAVLVVIAVFIGASALVRANAPTTIASAAELKTQQGAAERDIERAYEQASAQVAKVRALNLAIPAAQADQIASKALSDLKALRHSAFVSLGQVLGLAGTDAEGYATVTEQRFDQTPVASASAPPTPVLLAPRFYTIVSRMSDLATQLADNATTAMTASPSQTPAASRTPSPSPTR